ncbi:hypothetical protein AYK61_13735 [Rhodococcus sp. SBT000017]|uniref:ArnT family glycosyltransferase n=1 Tax=Rhodococcus sp. SBT000017 TaxID=1803385 RepID=UPI000EF8813A|nr:hypothetical protein [Rhodococcus sp. SBT000017]RMB77379.1 hypothetical protein AYK61_13735 [Rhodococcus sp. SBT000017]
MTRPGIVALVEDRRWRSSRLIAVAFGIAALGLVVYAIYSGLGPLRYADEKQYLSIARSLADGGGFSIHGRPSAYRPPVWPLMLSAFVLVGIDGSILVVLSAVFMIAAAALAGWICSSITGSRLGYLASVIMLVYPLNVYTAATLYPQGLATLLVLALWAVAIKADINGRKPLSFRASAGIGLLMACLSLAVPTLVFTAFLAGVWMLWQQRGNRVKFATVTLLFFAIPVALWAARNEQQLGEPVLFSTTSGENLVIGNNPSATGSSGVDIVYPPESIPPPELVEVERDAYFRDAALTWIENNPAEAAQLYISKTLNYFAPYNKPTTEGRGSALQMVVAIVAFGAVVVGLVARILLRHNLKMLPSEWAFLVVFALNAPFMAIFFTRTRFRQPLDSILIVEAVVAVVILVAGMRHMQAATATSGFEDGPAHEREVSERES